MITRLTRIAVLALVLVLGVRTGSALADTAGTVNVRQMMYGQGSATAGQTGNLTMAAVTTAAPAYTNGQTSPLNMTPGGLLRVDASGATIGVTQGALGTVINFQTAVTTSEAALATNTSKAVCVKAALANTAIVYLGTTAVTTLTGYELSAGDQICLALTNSNLVHAISASGTQTLTTVALN